MKATGIVRRIDDLGRVVIPKEIRRTMRIREGDPLEIYTDHDGEVIFKKYSPIGELTAFAAQYAETLHKTCDLAVLICDRDGIIACSGLPRKDYADKRISQDAERLIEARSIYIHSEGDKKINMVDSAPGQYYAGCIMPIITEGDIIGCVASMHTDSSAPIKDGDLEVKLIQTAANFLGKQLES